MSKPRSPSPARSRPGHSGPNDDQGRPHGLGVQRYQDGSRYEGDFVHGTIHGRGVYRYASGARYVGRFTEGLRGPKGTYTFACGTVYEGEYSTDARTGAGRMSFSASAGEAIRSQRRGADAPIVGPQTSHAAKFVGRFVNGRMHGDAGTLTFAAPQPTYHAGAASTSQVSAGDSFGYANAASTTADGSLAAAAAAATNMSSAFTSAGNISGGGVPPLASVASISATGGGVAAAVYSGPMEADLEQGKGVLVINSHATRIEGEFDRGAPTGVCTVLHVKSGERVLVRFDTNATAAVVGQGCTAAAAAAAAVGGPEPSSAPLRPCEATAEGRCGACGAVRRDALWEWLLPPETFAARVVAAVAPPPPEAATLPAARPTSAQRPQSAGGRGAVAATAAAQQKKLQQQQQQQLISSGDDDDEDEVIDLDATTGDEAPPPPPPPPPERINKNAATLKPSQVADAPMDPVALKERLVALEDRVALLLRDARPGLGMAIADCVRHVGGGKNDEDDGTSPGPVESRRPAAAGGGSINLPTDVRIVQIAPHSAASRAGFARGDYVLSVDGRAIKTRDDFTSLAFSAGDTVSVTIRQRRAPMGNAVETPNKSPSPARAGPVVTVDVVVGCTIGPAAVRALEDIRFTAAAAIAAVTADIAGSSAATNGSGVPRKAELLEWERTVASVRPSRFPEAWDRDALSPSPNRAGSVGREL